MPEILDFPDISIGEEVGVGIVYFDAKEILRSLEAVVQPTRPYTPPPAWREIWASICWRLSYDFKRIWNWVRRK